MQNRKVCTTLPCLPLYFIYDVNINENTTFYIIEERKNVAKIYRLQRFSIHIRL